jgi:hypothetical protein
MTKYLSPEVCKEIANKFIGLPSDMYYARFNRSWKLYSDVELDSMCNLLCEEPKEEFPAITFEVFQEYCLNRGFYGCLYPVSIGDTDVFTPIHTGWNWIIYEITIGGGNVDVVKLSDVFTGQDGMMKAKESCVKEMLKLL